MKPLPESFYRRPDVTAVARDLLGAVLCSRIDGVFTRGRIVETEAYEGCTDRASHAFAGRRTDRTEIMYGSGGRSYVYFCYGMHHLFNVVTNVRGVPHAVLVRALEPLEGLVHMQQRIGKPEAAERMASGPGKLCKALGITREHTGQVLFRQQLIWIEPAAAATDGLQLECGTRVGVAYAGADAYLPYRFWIKGHPAVSKAKGVSMPGQAAGGGNPQALRESW